MAHVARPARSARPFALALLCATVACGGDDAARGSAEDIVVAAHPDLWGRVQARVKAKLEPSLIGIRGVKGFRVRYEDPNAATWAERRRARQVLLIGTLTDPWMEEPLSELGDDPPTPPALAEAQDVWADDQRVTLLLLSEGDARRAVTVQLDSLRARFEQRYREVVITRAFEPGQADLDSLLTDAGFSILVPADYEASRDDDVFVFRKAAGDSTQLIRQVTVTWKSPIPQGMQGQGLLAWREQVGTKAFGFRQSVALGNVEATQTTHRGNVAYQLLGSWQGRRGGPSRGPLILRAVICQTQDRMYLVDAWLWAPELEQHAFLVELESIVNSFRCGSARGGQPNE